MKNRTYLRVTYLAIITVIFFMATSNASAATWPIPPENSYDEQNYAPRWDVRYNHFDLVTISDSLPLDEVVKEGRLHIPDNDPTITSMGDWRNIGQYWTSAQLTIPPSIDGNNARLEARIKAPISEGAVEARDPILEFSGINGKSAFVFWMADTWGGFWAKYAAGDTMVDNIPEFVRNFDDWHTVALETKNGKVTTFYDGQEVKSMDYQNSIGLLYSLRLGFKGRGSIDWVKLYEGDTLKLTEDFDIDGNTNVQFTESEPEACCSSVMFLPGLEASRLYRKDGSGEDQLWEPTNRNEDVRQLYLDSDGKSVDSGIYTRDVMDEIYGFTGNVYKGFMESMDQFVADGVINEWKPIPYDWRLPLDKIVEDDVKLENGEHMNIIGELKRMAAESKTKKVTLIGHSNGGLLAKVLIDRLKESGDEKLVDKLIMVGTPQLGTPKAVASLLHGDGTNLLYGIILDKKTGRGLAENMTSAYNLLPSKEYFSTVQSPVIEFDEDVKDIYDFRSLYGEKIDNWVEFKKFMLGDDGKRSDPEAGDTDSPNVLRETLLSRADDTHDDLDDWQAPSGMEVIQIAGWGLDTIRGIEYDDCDIPFCPDKLSNLDRSLLFTQDGDETVVVSSAVELGGNAERYYLNLKSYNEDENILINNKHADILEINPLQDFVKSIIQDDKTLTDYISAEKPEVKDEDKRLRFRLHSPVSVDLYDEDGNHTGLIKNPDSSSDIKLYEEQIPNSYYIEFGEKKYAGAGDSLVNIKLTGEDLGTFTFDIDEIAGDKVAKTTTFSDIPVIKDMEATLSVYNGVSEMKIDVDNDGEEDAVIQSGEDMREEYQLEILGKIVDSLQINKNIKNSLVKKINMAQKQMEKRHKIAANVILESVKLEIRIFSGKLTPKKLRISEEDAQKLIEIIERIQENDQWNNKFKRGKIKL